MDFKKMKENYLKQTQDYKMTTKKLYAELTNAERIIERNKKALNQLVFPSWVDSLVKPIGEYFTKELDLDYEIYGPFGMRAQVTIYWRKDMDKSITEQPVKSLSLVPGDLSKGELFYETGKEKNNHGYEKGSIGYLNGFHKDTKLLPNSIDEIKKLIK